MNADKVRGDAPAQSQGEEDELFALGAEAYVWCFSMMLAAGTALVATDADKPLANARLPFKAFAHGAGLITGADESSG